MNAVLEVSHEELANLPTETFSERKKRTDRQYQTDCRTLTENALFDGKKRILIESPTGTGKTYMMKLIMLSEKVREALGKSPNDVLKVLFITHKNILNYQAFQEYGNESKIDLIGQSAMSDIPKETIDYGWDITFIDECHHEAMESLQRILPKISSKPIIGVSATPERGDFNIIKFEEIIIPITRQEAVEQGYLSKTDLISICDTSGKNKAPIISEVLENFHKEMGQTIIFVNTKKEINQITKTLDNLGLSNVGLLEQTDEELIEVIEYFESGDIQFLVTCQKISEGVNTTNCDTVFLGKQFSSNGEVNQAIGRGARLKDSGLNCTVWQLSHPSKDNVDALDIVDEVETHRLAYSLNDEWQIVDY